MEVCCFCVIDVGALPWSRGATKLPRESSSVKQAGGNLSGILGCGIYFCVVPTSIKWCGINPRCFKCKNYLWRSGQLGLGDETARGRSPSDMGVNLSLVDLGTNRTATRVGCGQHHSCAVLDNGSLKCWGRNNNGM